MAVVINPLALTTLDTLKSALSITGSSANDLLTLAINGSTAAIERFCNRTFGRAVITSERQPIKGGPRLVVNRPPINAVTSITIEDSLTALDSTNYVVESAGGGIVYVKSGLPLGGMRRWGVAQDVQPGTEPPSLLVTYNGGFVTPQQAIDNSSPYYNTTPTLPDDIQIACLRYAADLYRSLPRGSEDIASEGVGDAQVSYRDDDQGGRADEPTLPRKVAALVRPYRRLAFV